MSIQCTFRSTRNSLLSAEKPATERETPTERTQKNGKLVLMHVMCRVARRQMHMGAGSREQQHSGQVTETTGGGKKEKWESDGTNRKI